MNQFCLTKDCEQYLVLTYTMVCPKFCPAKVGLWNTAFHEHSLSSWAVIILQPPDKQGNYLCHFSLLLLPSNFSQFIMLLCISESNSQNYLLDFKKCIGVIYGKEGLRGMGSRLSHIISKSRQSLVGNITNLRLLHGLFKLIDDLISVHSKWFGHHKSTLASLGKVRSLTNCSVILLHHWWRWQDLDLSRQLRGH